jgi:hypothetical protein
MSRAQTAAVILLSSWRNTRIRQNNYFQCVYNCIYKSQHVIRNCERGFLYKTQNFTWRVNVHMVSWNSSEAKKSVQHYLNFLGSITVFRNVTTRPFWKWRISQDCVTTRDSFQLQRTLLTQWQTTFLFENSCWMGQYHLLEWHCLAMYTTRVFWWQPIFLFWLNISKSESFEEKLW